MSATPFLHVPRLLEFQACNRIKPVTNGSADTGPWIAAGDLFMTERLTALLHAVDPAVMLLLLSGWQVNQIKLSGPAGSKTHVETVDIAGSSFSKLIGSGTDSACWAVPISTAVENRALPSGTSWELRLVVQPFPSMAERFRVTIDGLSDPVEIESGSQPVIRISASGGTALSENTIFQQVCQQADNLCSQLIVLLADGMKRTSDLSNPGSASGMLGMFFAGSWHAGPLESSALLTEWQTWMEPICQWITSHLLTDAGDPVRQTEFWQSLALPRKFGGRSLDAHAELMLSSESRPAAKLNIPALYHLMEEYLKNEGRWQQISLFMNPLLNDLSLGHGLFLLSNEGAVNTLAGITVDVLPLALAILDAIQVTQVDPDDENWQILLMFVRQFPTHARIREAVEYLVGNAPNRSVFLRGELYNALLTLCQNATYEETTNNAAYATVLDCVVWLREVLLTEIPDTELDGFLNRLGGEIDTFLAKTGPSNDVQDDRFLRVLLELARFHPYVESRYACALAATSRYLPLNGIGRSDPGFTLFRDRFIELCNLSISCLGWDHNLADPSNLLANHLQQLLGVLGLASPGLEAIDWAAVGNDSQQRITDALVADAGGLHNPADAYQPVTGQYDLRGSEQYLLVMAGLEIASNPANFSNAPTGITERIDPLSASRYLNWLETYTEPVRSIIIGQNENAIDDAIKARFGTSTTKESVIDAHIARLFDPCTIAWAATLDTDARKEFVDSRILSIAAVDQVLANDAAAKFSTLVAEMDPVGLLVDLSDVEAEHLAELVADAAADNTTKSDIKVLVKALIDLSKADVYISRFWIQIREEDLKKASDEAVDVLSESNSKALQIRIAGASIRRHPELMQEITELREKSLNVQSRLNQNDLWKIPVRGFGALVAVAAIYVRFQKDDFSLFVDGALVLKDLASLIDHLGGVVGSRFLLKFNDFEKMLARGAGRIVSPFVDLLVFYTSMSASIDHFFKGEYERGVVDLIYAGVALTSAAVGTWVLWTAWVTAETPPVALVILAVGGVITAAVALYEHFILEPSLAEAFLNGLEDWLLSVRVVYPEVVALYPPALPETINTSPGEVGFYGDRPIQGNVRIDWDERLHLNDDILDRGLLGTFIPAEASSWDGALEFRSPLSGTVHHFGTGGVFSSGDAVIYLTPDFSDRIRPIE